MMPISFEAVCKSKNLNAKFRRVLYGGKEFHWFDGFFSEDGCGEPSPIDRAGINIETVWTLVRDAVLGRCVSVDNETAEVLAT
jgi:hypothetical protein